MHLCTLLGIYVGVSGVLKVRNTGSEKVCIVIIRGKWRRMAYLSPNLWRDIAYEKGGRKIYIKNPRKNLIAP